MHDGSGWRMLQGGLARVLGAGERVAESVPAGAVLKDVWVLNEEGGFIQGPAPAIQAALPVRRSAGNLPSRVAEELYWLGRRVERLDGQARVGRAGLVRRARGAPLPREIAELQVLGRCLRAAGLEDGGAPDADRRPAAGGAAAAGLDRQGADGGVAADRGVARTG